MERERAAARDGAVPEESGVFMAVGRIDCYGTCYDTLSSANKTKQRNNSDKTPKLPDSTEKTPVQIFFNREATHPANHDYGSEGFRFDS